MKKLLTAFAALMICFSAFTLTACANCNEKYIGIEGTVIDKEFIPAHKKSQFIWCGKFGYTTYRHYPDAWYLTVEYDMDGNIEETRYEVTETVYNEYEIGDTYIYNGEEVDE